MKVGGVCALAYAVGLVALFILLGSTGLMEGDGATQVLPLLHENRRIALAAALLLIALPLSLAAFGLGMFHALRQMGSVMWIATASFVGGAFLIVYRGFVWVAVTTVLAPAYVAASGDAKEAIATVADTLERFAYMADLTGAVLLAGIGLLLFALAARRTSLTARWVAWLGLFGAIAGGWLTLLVPLSEVFGAINLLGTISYLIWIVAMGIALLRAPDSVGQLARPRPTAGRR